MPMLIRALLPLSTALLLLTPKLAQACGGTFCDGGAVTPMPVDQTGEDILFVRDGGEIEVHVRIEYSGEAERFAWLVPLQAVPEVSVGSEALFQALSPATIPQWSTTTTWEDPGDAPNGGGPPGGTLDLSGDGGDDPPPVVVLDEVVGAFEVVVLQGGSAAEVLDFFDQNNYAFDDDAEPLIQQYIDEGFLIVGVKLTTDAAVEAIHPLVFRFPGDEPCVPIRLTAVAAQDDMGIRAYFLGQHRWAPTNYRHVVLNPLAYDWGQGLWPDYLERLSLAVDEAGGHAFATEYAGPSEVVPTDGIWDPSWSSAGIEVADAPGALDLLQQHDLLGPTISSPIHPQLLPLLREYIPPPDDWAQIESAFWLNHAQHEELLDPLAWDGPAFAAALDERVIEPAMHAVDLLDAWPYLTRLHTTISTPEMTLDPTFHEAPDLPGVLDDRSTTALVLRGGDWTRFDIPYGLSPSGSVEERELLCVGTGEPWPDTPSSVLRIEQIPTMGPAQVIVDNDAALRAWAQSSYEDSVCGMTSLGEDIPDADFTPGKRGACACSTEGETGETGPYALGLGLLFLVSSRRGRGPRPRPRAPASARRP